MLSSKKLQFFLDGCQGLRALKDQGGHPHEQRGGWHHPRHGHSGRGALCYRGQTLPARQCSGPQVPNKLVQYVL